MISNKLFFIIGLFLNVFVGFSQTKEPLKNQAPFENQIYKEGINTVLAYKEGWELSMPIIELNTKDKIVFCFDEYGTKKNRYQYTVIHCNPDWTESGLNSFEYVEGQNVGNIEKFTSSQNTLFKYNNYQLVLPNKDINLLFSGNYVLKVFEEDEPEKLVFTRRFYVFESLVNISSQVEKFTLNRKDGLNQRLSFSLDFNENDIENPLHDLSFKILKNNESEKNFNTLKPKLILPGHIEYSNNDALLFAGGNEFRHFDLKNYKFLSDRLEKIEKNNEYHSVLLKTDEPRDEEQYAPEKDINGKRLIKLEGQEKSYMLADYSEVKFELKMPISMLAGDFYIYGSLTDYKLTDKNKMIYNPVSGKYEKSMFLKQGYYNYIYWFETSDKFNNREADKYLIEGNHFETENEFHVLVYYRPTSGIYNQLVGYNMKTSK